jgi:hypothetical protein
MSLILDALRKLERDKDAREPGVVVVGSVPWGERRSRRSLVLAIAAAFLVLLAGGWWLVGKVPGPPSQRTPPAAAPTSTPATAPDAPPAVPHSPASAAAAPPATAPPLRPLVLPAPDAAADAPAEAPPAAGRAASSDDVRLSAISQRDGRPVALINDRLVFEGDSVDGIKVLRIGEAEVEVEVRGKRRVLRF